MKNRRVLSIDLGSAYTKIAVRPDWNAEAGLLHELPLATPEVDFCIPSVVARIERGGATTWTIGAPAAAEVPGPGVTIYRYWKARLFSPDPGTESARDEMGLSFEAGRADDYPQVATHFFRELRETLEHSPFAGALHESAVRVCVPKMEASGDADGLLAEILARSGWRPARGRTTVYEPESNACGVFTRGRNATWFPPRVSFTPSEGRSLQLREMLEPEGLLAAFRRVAGSFGVLVIDIGGFTTDFGYVEFDTGFSSAGWQRPTIVQQSYELGIRELDHAIFHVLDEEAREVVQQLSSGEWDEVKSRLYHGEAVVLERPDGRHVTIGRDDDFERIGGVIQDFAARVIQVRDRFREAYIRGPVNAQTLTGGGAMISSIRQAISRELASDARAQVHDLLDEAEPERTLTLRGNRFDGSDVEARARRNLELVRGASAIGGCSVFFE
jgi:actin-like ATPase involved in cell morphogenesis